MAITETVLEMHYHKPLMDFFRKHLGIGKGGVNFYKYSPQKEVFVGFDQAYAMSELSDDDFFEMLKESSTKANYKLSKKFLAIFLQFKVVKKMSNIQKITPPTITAKPHFRVKLDTTRNQKTGCSQHELLFNLNGNEGALVYYACPMIFDKSSLYEIKVDLDQLKLVDVDSSPSQYSDNEVHYIYFNSESAVPIWCSEPKEGKQISLTELAEEIRRELNQLDPFESSKRLDRQLRSILKTVHADQQSTSMKEQKEESPFAAVHDSLMILEVEQESF